MENGGLEDKLDNETTKLTIRKALVTAVQRAPEPAPTAQPAPTASAGPPPAPSGHHPPDGLPHAHRRGHRRRRCQDRFRRRVCQIWLSKEPSNAKDGGPGSSSGVRSTNEPLRPDHAQRGLRQPPAAGRCGRAPGRGADLPHQCPAPAGPNDLFAQLNREQPEVLILGPDVPVDEALRLATVLDVQVPDLTVLLVSEPDPDFILQAMRAGIRDILSPLRSRADAGPLERACQSFANRHRQEPAQAG